MESRFLVGGRMIKWWILDINGKPLISDEPRPEDSNPDNGDPNTPWYQTKCHVHLSEEGKLEGVHWYGTLKEAQEALHKRLSTPK